MTFDASLAQMACVRAILLAGLVLAWFFLLGVLVTMVRLVHISDIHFNKSGPGLGFDPDEDLRNEICRDLKGLCAKDGNADAILVTGDIAYSGKSPEYDSASEWLDKLCLAAGCSVDAVYVCPGNHDIDQSVIRSNSLLQDAQDAVRMRQLDEERETHFRRRLEESEARKLFYAPLQQFNEFASRYECSFFADQGSYVWESDLLLDDNSILRIRGLNSTLLSGLSDQEGSLFLGRRASTLPRRDGVEYLTLAHHPPNWLLDGRAVDDDLNDRARIQLFGHEHDHRIIPGRDSVRVYAGAVCPSRDEPHWRPGYNVMDISVKTTSTASGPDRKMILGIHAREWQTRPTQFRSHLDRNGEPVHKMEFQLQPWSRPEVRTQSVDNSTSLAVPLREEAMETGNKRSKDDAAAMRALIYKFFRLSVSKKSEIAGHLNLLEVTDQSLPDFERYKRALVRAKDRGVLPELQALIVSAERE